MKKLNDDYLYSPTDLTTFLESEFVTWMERFDLDFPGVVIPDPIDEESELLFKKGQEHENSFLKELYDTGQDVCEIVPNDNRYIATQEAMKSGRGIIYQAALTKGHFTGLADFMIRVDTPSELGNFSYEVGDTKLSRKAKPSHIIQLCCYAEMIEAIQGIRPQWIQVMLGNGQIKRFRTNDYFYYYLQVKQAFLQQQLMFEPSQKHEPTYGDDFGRWSSYAKTLLDQQDHLSQVANITRIQIKRLENAGVRTLTSLATTQLKHIPKVNPLVLERLKQQARLQLESKALDRPKYELIKLDEGLAHKPYGLSLLPPTSPLDIFFDMEGYPLVDGGLEYLFGVTYLENGEPQFKDWWAHNPIQEKAAFEGFMDWVYQRYQEDPLMHIYHYNVYEVAALRKLMGRYGTKEKEVDDLLRHEVFIDLYKVVRQGIRVGEPSYSIKNIEHLYMDARTGDVKNAGLSVVYYERWLETQDGQDWQTSTILNEIRNYNKDDCISTWKLAQWLRGVQQQNGIEWIGPPENRQDESSANDGLIFGSAAELARTILASLPMESDTENGEESRISELLAWLLEFHRREKKPTWWAYFDRLSKTSEELADDPDCLALLTRTDTPAEAVKRSKCFEYRYNPDQDTKLTAGKICHFLFEGEALSTTIESLDTQQGLIRIKLSLDTLQNKGLADNELPQSIDLIPYENIPYKTIEEAIFRVVKAWWQTQKLPPALNDFLRRNHPRRSSGITGDLIPETLDTLEGTLNTILDLDKSTLCIQGPPGAGKTFTAAHVIVALLSRGKTIGMTSNSHKAIVNLMAEVAKIAVEKKCDFKGAKTGSDIDEELTQYPFIQQKADIKKLTISMINGIQFVGGTAWTFSNECVEGKFDYLFVDEAGQVPIANLVGMSLCADNIVLLGDQMQLNQPIQGAHPGESGLSILEYYLEDHATIPPDKGIFLEKTFRLHPNICEFISDCVYDGRLKSVESDTLKRHLVFSGRPNTEIAILKQAGILYLPVFHEGNSQSSEEEVEAIQSVVSFLLKQEHVNKQGEKYPLALEDILFVAPFNMQVRMLQDAFGPSARVGSVDKFQGQQAPIVIVSLCASSGEDINRGLEFLLCKNRLNVAISRAQVLAIVVGSPTLALTRCSSIEQMALLNLYCRLIEEYSITPEPELLEPI